MNTAKGFQVSQGLGAVLIVLGAAFLLAQLTGLDIGRYGWPLFVILPGLALFAGMVMGGKAAAPLAIPASIVTTVGLILFYQNVTGRFETWAYAWALIFPTAIGLGTLIQGWWSADARLEERGRQLGTLGLTVFFGFAFFFEIILNFSGMAGGALSRFAGPVLLIAGGVLLLMRRNPQEPEAAEGFAAEPRERETRSS
ncbi:MAG: hypothetical protein M3511_03680 [Deinococcota bacterium]|jgi:hypothetical protein|nr:hypothetical protein [Deinococcota bacterium]